MSVYTRKFSSSTNASMKVSAFLSLLRNNTLQNVSYDMYNENDLMNYVNAGLNHIYNFILAKTDWYWAFTVETLDDTKRQALP